MDERTANVGELLVRLDKEYTERRPDQRWEEYYTRELLRHYSPG